MFPRFLHFLKTVLAIDLLLLAWFLPGSAIEAMLCSLETGILGLFSNRRPPMSLSRREQLAGQSSRGTVRHSRATHRLLPVKLGTAWKYGRSIPPICRPET